MSDRARDPADERGDADVEAAVLLAVHADVVARASAASARPGRRAAARRGTRSRAPRGTSRRPSRPAGTSGAPCCAGAGSRSRGRSAVTPCQTSATCSGATKTPRRSARRGRRREAAADPQVVADAELGVLDRDERDVVDLVHDVLAGVAGDRRLELARQVREDSGSPMKRLVISSICGVGSMSSSAAMPATGEPRMTRGTSPHASVVAEPDGLEAAPDLGHVLDADPVQLDVLPVGEVGGVAAELGRDAADHAQLLGGELARRRCAPAA